MAIFRVDILDYKPP